MNPASQSMLEIQMTLYADEAQCLTSLTDPVADREQDMQSCERNFVRAACAAIEGSVHGMKYAAFATFIESSVHLSRGETALLDEAYGLKDNGQIHLAPAKIRILSNVRFAFTMYARAHHVVFKLILE